MAVTQNSYLSVSFQASTTFVIVAKHSWPFLLCVLTKNHISDTPIAIFWLATEIKGSEPNQVFLSTFLHKTPTR